MWVGSDYWNNNRKMASSKRWDHPWSAVCSFTGLCGHCSRYPWIIWSSSRRGCGNTGTGDTCCAWCLYLEPFTVLSCHHSHNWKEQSDPHHKQQGMFLVKYVTPLGGRRITIFLTWTGWVLLTALTDITKVELLISSCLQLITTFYSFIYLFIIFSIFFHHYWYYVMIQNVA